MFPTLRSLKVIKFDTSSYGRVHFLLRSISPSQIHLNYSVIVPCFSSPSQKENLLNAFSNQNVGKYSTFSNGNTFSAPSQMEYNVHVLHQ